MYRVPAGALRLAWAGGRDPEVGQMPKVHVWASEGLGSASVDMDWPSYSIYDCSLSLPPKWRLKLRVSVRLVARFTDP